MTHGRGLWVASRAEEDPNLTSTSYSAPTTAMQTPGHLPSCRLSAALGDPGQRRAARLYGGEFKMHMGPCEPPRAQFATQQQKGPLAGDLAIHCLGFMSSNSSSEFQKLPPSLPHPPLSLVGWRWRVGFLPPRLDLTCTPLSLNKFFTFFGSCFLHLQDGAEEKWLIGRCCVRSNDQLAWVKN